MICTSISSSFLLTLLFLTLSYNTQSAPTHHLTIGVQGNTPTLIVTSSEIGITPQTMGFTKKLIKPEHTAKFFKDLDAQKKSFKIKLNKNYSVLNKKEKTQYMPKPLKKQMSSEENLFEVIENVDKPKQTKLFKDPEIATKSLVDFEITTSEATPIITTDNIENYETNLQLTTLPPELISDSFVVASKPSLTTEQPEEVSITSRATTDTYLLGISEHHQPLVLFTTISSYDFDDTAATTYSKNAITATTVAKGLAETQTVTKRNDVVDQTSEEIREVLKDTIVIKPTNEYDKDRYVRNPVATKENENLLLTTIKAKEDSTTDTTEFSKLALNTLITDNAEATTASEILYLPLTMTTIITESSDNNSSDNSENEQQQFITEKSETVAYRLTTESDTTVKENEAKNTLAAETLVDNDGDVITEQEQEFTTITITKQQMLDDLKSTENPVQVISMSTEHKLILNAGDNKSGSKTIEETDLVTTGSIPVAHIEQLTTENAVDNPLKISTSEAVIKLIDLEKPVPKTTSELKQSSLLTAGQYDNGHDGLKNIKKKQLIDKHYVETLPHNKQVLHSKNSKEIEKLLISGTQATTDVATEKPLLMPIKHGYLGPILMEEKTFHVVHHPDSGTKNKNHHLTEVESQLRNGNFVELKAKTELSEPEQNEKKIPANKNTKIISFEDKKTLKMQSDQPVLKSKLFFEITKKQNKSQQVDNNSEILVNNSQKGMEHHDNLKLATKHALLSSFKIPVNETKQLLTDTTINRQDVLEKSNQPKNILNTTVIFTDTLKTSTEPQTKAGAVLSTTVFQTMNSMATKTPALQANTLFTSKNTKEPLAETMGKEQTESKISDIQIEVYDSTIDSIVASTNFKDGENKHHIIPYAKDESSLGRTTKPPVATIQQERFTQYVIDRTETSTQEPINYSTIQVASGKPEPAAIEIHINVSESFGNESEDLEFSYPQTEYTNNKNERIQDESYDDSKDTNNIKLKISSNSNGNGGKEVRNDEILVVEIVDTDNVTDSTLKITPKNHDELFISDVKNLYSTPPPPPPPPPYQNSYDRDSDTIFYISNTEVKVGESLPNSRNANEERKHKLESQFFPANYMASTHPNIKNPEETNPPHHLYEEDIILSSSRNQADALKIYRNRNEPSPPLDVTYVGESIIEVEQSPDSAITTTYAPDQRQQQQHNVAIPQEDVVIQPAILPEISIGVPVIGELPPQIELKEIDFMPNEAQLHRSGIYDDNDSDNSNSNNNLFNNDIDENTINGGNSNSHDVDVVNNNQRVDESSIQYGGDLIDESADGGFDGVEGSYPFGNPVAVAKASSSSYTSEFMTKLRKQQQQQPNHVADYAHLYVNYGVNNMRKDELSADVKDSGEILLVGNGKSGSGGNINVASVNSNEQNITTFKEFQNKVGMSNSTMPFISANSTQNERMSNATAFSVMEDANDLEDKNTEDIVNLISLAIGLFIVILPIVVTCSMFWALRYLYKKYHLNFTDNGGYSDQTETKSPLNEDGIEKGEFAHEPSSSPTNSNKDTIEKYTDTSKKPSTTDSNIKFSTENSSSILETLTSNTNTAVNATTNFTSTTTAKTNDTLKLSLALSSPITHKQVQSKSPTSVSSTSTLTNKITTECINNVRDNVESEDGDDGDDIEMPGPNGSITKMTLENNLLIVETEERNDISRLARETKMDYNKDGVFVVEVSRGIDSKNIPESPVTDGTEKMLSMFDTKPNNGGLSYKMANEKNSINNEKVQIHSPPPENSEEGPRSLHQIEEVEEPTNSPNLMEKCNDQIVSLSYRANTGLSQSDLSSTSSSDSNKGYCYGNQELYVVEQGDYSANRQTGNVILKCDAKDINDDDRNPENDHYLKHSLGKMEEGKEKEDIMEGEKKTEEGESRTSSGESPAQKQTDKAKEKPHNNIDVKAKQIVGQKEIQNSDVTGQRNAEEKVLDKHSENCSNRSEASPIYNNVIPVEIEVHITPTQTESSWTDNTLSPVKSSVTSESQISNAVENVSEPVILETISTELVDTIMEATPPLAKTLISNLDETDILAVPDKFSDSVALKEVMEEKITLNNSVNQRETESSSVVNGLVETDAKNLQMTESEVKDTKKSNEEILIYINGTGIKEDSKEYKEKQLVEDECMTPVAKSLIPSEPGHLPADKVLSVEKTELAEDENVLQSIAGEINVTDLQNGLTQVDIKPITNGTTILPDLVRSSQLHNGSAAEEPISNSLTDLENGYDSIISLPEPPPSSEDQPNSDLSDQQLDSLPPPPPPEIFNLKDLSPPFTNGNEDSPQSEESNNFYNTLPPPPPTTLEVTATTAPTTTTNGKVHASPLTPPASPPAHFTNNLHVGLCSQPIAVDVNSS